ncbi:MAG: hypothetical protein ACJ79A_06175 [Gemmatimonadaceae bacterium]
MPLRSACSQSWVRGLAASGLVAVAANCAQSAKGVKPFEGATQVTIVALNHDTLANITDSAQVRALARFVNARLEGWEVDWAGVAVGDAHAEFRHDAAVIGTFGIGHNFFERYPAGDQLFATRDATQDELEEFARLAKLELAILIGSKNAPSDRLHSRRPFR